MNTAMDNLPPILVLEDEPADEYVIRRILEQNFANPVVIVDNTRKAVAVLEQISESKQFGAHREPVALVLDLKVPGVPGQQLITWARTHPAESIRELPIAVLTHLPPEEVKEEVIERGASVYHHKPCDPGKIIDSLQHLTGVTVRPYGHRLALTR